MQRESVGQKEWREPLAKKNRGGDRLPVPEFREDGWLPVGHHPADWEEVAQLFGGEPGTRRRVLTEKLLEYRDALRGHGVTGTMLLGGSYILSLIHI